MSIHVTEAEAERDFAGLLAKVRAGEEVVIGAETAPVAVLRPVLWPKPRTLEECLAIAVRQETEQGQEAVMDPEFADDLEEIVRNRSPWSPPAWD
jgi:antitoxin (DNA-binding transcriptional repressor) of toxin-antitoxin stability system